LIKYKKINKQKNEKALFKKIHIPVAFVISHNLSWYGPTKDVYRNDK
jgi:hypothetical protein